MRDEVAADVDDLALGPLRRPVLDALELGHGALLGGVDGRSAARRAYPAPAPRPASRRRLGPGVRHRASLVSAAGPHGSVRITCPGGGIGRRASLRC